MPALNGEQWSGFRRPFRGNPQQGTLFDVREVPSVEVDSPGNQAKGRRREMLEAMPQVKVYSGDPRHAEMVEKRRGRQGTSLPPGLEDADPEVYLKNTSGTAAGKKRQVEMAHQLAGETTVPPSDLAGLRQITEGQYHTDAPKFGSGTRAFYSQHGVNTPHIAAREEMELGTLVHEIGHHASHTQDPHMPRQSAVVGGPSTKSWIRPREEGRADAYVDEHLGEREHSYEAVYPELIHPGEFAADEYQLGRYGGPRPPDKPQDEMSVAEESPWWPQGERTEEGQLLQPELFNVMAKGVGFSEARKRGLDWGKMPVDVEVSVKTSEGEYDPESVFHRETRQLD